MTKFKVGDKVEVFDNGHTSKGWVGVQGIVETVLGHGYHVTLTEAAKTSEKVGYVAYLTGSNLKLIEETTFKVGDRVEFIEHFTSAATTGTQATVTYTTSGGTYTTVKTDDGEEYTPYSRRLKLIEEPALTLGGFTVGDKVRYTGSLWKNLEGVVSSINGNLLDIRVTKLHDNVGSYSSVRVGKTLVETCGGKGIDTHSLVKIEEPKPFTFEDIQVGDTIRRTLTRKSGAKEVREGTVSKVASWYAEDNSYILAYDTDTAEAEDVTLELLNRPKPKVKAVWEDAKPGTVITRGDDHLILNDKGWLVLYSDGSTQQFGKDDADVLVNYDSKVLAPTS